MHYKVNFKLVNIKLVNMKLVNIKLVNIKRVIIVKSQYLRQLESFNNNKPVYKTKNIYNTKGKISYKHLQPFNIIQILMQNFDCSV